jgi:hypothetical protein
VTRGFLILSIALFASGEILPMVSSAHAQEIPLPRYLPDIKNRQSVSDIVCFGTILQTQSTTSVTLDGKEYSESLATARVDRIIKGDLYDRVIRFKYYDLAMSSGDYFGPPLAHFVSGIRYAFFLKSDGADLKVAVPL